MMNLVSITTSTRGDPSISVVPHTTASFKPVSFIDYKKPESNDFLVGNQMKFHGRLMNSIPDLTVFINGIPIAIIECKSPNSLSAFDKAFEDLKYYQQNSEKLCWYNQICAGIFKVGGRYGAIGAGKPHYSFYRTKDTNDLEALLGETPTAQDILIYNLFKKENLLDLIRHFVIYELDEGRTIKKLPRYPQIRATNNAIKKFQEQDQGGVIWHTQGSGKSITMVMLAKALALCPSIPNPRIVIVTYVILIHFHRPRPDHIHPGI